MSTFGQITHRRSWGGMLREHVINTPDFQNGSLCDAYPKFQQMLLLSQLQLLNRKIDHELQWDYSCWPTNQGSSQDLYNCHLSERSTVKIINISTYLARQNSRRCHRQPVDIYASAQKSETRKSANAPQKRQCVQWAYTGRCEGGHKIHLKFAYCTYSPLIMKPMTAWHKRPRILTCYEHIDGISGETRTLP